MSDSQSIEEEIIKRREIFDSREFDSYFKYFSDDLEVLEGIFENHVIRFTQPRALNDPLEFNPTISFHDKANYQYYKLNGVLLPSVASFYRVQIIESQINNYGILSLTKNYDSFNMWSQYANGHRGFIIEFKPDFNTYTNMKSQSGEIYDIREVSYVDEYSICLDDIVDENDFIPHKKVFDELFFKKTSRWKHEKEYRIVRPLSDCPNYHETETNYVYTDTNIYLIPFDLDSISSIILGANMSQENKVRIASICEKNKIALSQAHIVRNVKDRFGERGEVIILPIDETNRGFLTTSKPQLFCTDTICLEHKDVKEIRNINELPYYKDYQQIVDDLYKELKES
jgi:hypothetical protein